MDRLRPPRLRARRVPRLGSLVVGPPADRVSRRRRRAHRPGRVAPRWAALPTGGPRNASSPRDRVLTLKAERLRDDVALDLGGAAVDRRDQGLADEALHVV